MMAIIGFLLLCAVGLVLVCMAIGGAVVTPGYAGNIEWPRFILFGGSGSDVLWLAFSNCPFSIVIG